MIEFIVLGIVPGTSFQIDINHVATVFWVAFIAYCARNNLDGKLNRTS